MNPKTLAACAATLLLLGACSRMDGTYQGDLGTLRTERGGDDMVGMMQNMMSSMMAGASSAAGMTAASLTVEGEDATLVVQFGERRRAHTGTIKEREDLVLFTGEQGTLTFERSEDGALTCADCPMQGLPRVWKRQ
jgi:uncharacterized lipoprotein NlpE involved in copper resistance